MRLFFNFKEPKGVNIEIRIWKNFLGILADRIKTLHIKHKIWHNIFFHGLVPVFKYY